jgi:hypothetical protein
MTGALSDSARDRMDRFAASEIDDAERAEGQHPIIGGRG